MKLILTIFFLSCTLLLSSGQYSILEQPELLQKVEKCLYATYGFRFDEAGKIKEDLKIDLPGHPAPYFLEALVVYWENFPLLPDDAEVVNFEKAMEKTIALSKELKSQPDGEMEGIFFDLHARAFRGMFWADNGRPGKVIADIDNLYRSTMQGIEMKDQFNEFYFSSGLYNYYIDAYVEKHPIYKPVSLLFRKGNRKKGLQELEYASKNSTYIKYESILFMSLLQLNYERDMESALDYMSVLYNHFPENIYYLSQYLVILLHSKHFAVAEALNSKLGTSNNQFELLIYNMTEGFLNENYRNTSTVAEKNYLSVIKSYDNFGDIANLYVAIAYAGLARIADKEGDMQQARKFRRRSSRYASYEFIPGFR